MADFASSKLESAVGTISDFVDFYEAAKDHGVTSLSDYTKRTLIASRVYIEDKIAGEPTMMSILKLLNQIYAGLVFSALGLNNIISGSHTVRHMLAAVSTEEFHQVVDMIKAEFGDQNVSVKAVEDSSVGNKIGDLKNKLLGDDPAESSHKQMNLNEHKLDADASKLFTGRLMEVTMGSGDKQAKVYFFVQLMPYILPELVMEEFLGNNIEPSKALRKAQWKSGEISFWKDFIFEADRIAKRKRALRMDKDGILREVEDHRQSSIGKSISNWFRTQASIRHNVANTIIVVSKQKLDDVCRQLGLNVRSFADRQKILNNTLSTILVAYDPNYETIDMYMNGIQNRGEYSAQMINSLGKKDDGVDMKQLLTVIAAGNAPRF